MSGRTRFRPLDGIVLLDKPRALSSNQALQRVRHLFRAAKAGHTGSLDPLATGLLPICFGEATKLAGGLLGACKAYDTIARLGIETDTDDADGEVLVERPLPELGIAQINAALTPLTGHIQQRPPIYSALKRGGEPLYAKARRGETIEIEPRPVEVHRFTLNQASDLQTTLPHLHLHVECGSGTYVRALVRDLGQRLGCGAHVTELRRLWVDPFQGQRMWILDELRTFAESGEDALDACLLPIETGLQSWPRMEVNPAAARRLGYGQHVAGTFAPPGEVAIFSDTGRALGLGEVSPDGNLRPKRLFSWATSTRTDKPAHHSASA